MIRLSQVIEATRPETVIGFRDRPVTGIACHPAKLSGEGMLFACIDEYLEYNRWQTWRAHLEELPLLNPAAVIVPRPVEGLAPPQLVCREPRQALGLAARLFHGDPDSRMRTIGVTGTNGKTTTTRLLEHLLTHLGIPAASIGTLGLSLSGSEWQKGTYTTPLAPDLYANLKAFADAGAEAVAMEVSSHALALDRVAGITFDGAILTNIERDHLDFHGTPEAYAKAKERLFRMVKPDGCCLLNRASPYCEPIARVSSGRVHTYGLEDPTADTVATDIVLEPARSRFRVTSGTASAPFEMRLAGGFLVENALAAIALVHDMGHPLETIAQAIAGFEPVCGRMEQIPLPNGATAIVDYAHNPDGLQNLVTACRSFCRGNLHLVFGCGGDRDRGKRPLMGGIAGEGADHCWVTSDNPRTEDPQRIIGDILEGMKGTPATVTPLADRREAICAAYASTAADDLLVVAGKGHEDYQIIGTDKQPFSDQAVLRSLGG